MFLTAVPVVHVSDSLAAEEFYCKRLGFTLVSSWRPDNAKSDPCYMTVTRDGAQMHLSSFKGAIVGGSAVYVFVDNVDLLYDELLAKGVQVPQPPVDQTWGTREIWFRDGDQNLVSFGQRKPN